MSKPLRWSFLVLASVRSVSASPLQEAECASDSSRGAESDEFGGLYPTACSASALLQSSWKRDASQLRVSTSLRRTAQCEQKFAWLHIPKCGTSFANTLFHAANSSLPADAQLPSQESSDDRYDLISQFLAEYPLDNWFDGCFWTGRHSIPGQHDGILQDDFDKFDGHFVAFFREPVARAKSSYEYFKSRCEAGLDTAGAADEEEYCSASPATYAKKQIGLMTQMLTGQLTDSTNCIMIDADNTSRPCPELAEKPDVSLALQRLEGFKFVGLTEEWNLSVCLFHKMFGGSCLDQEFENTRPATTDPETADDQDDDFWKTFVDPSDNMLYEAVSSKFWRNVAKYNATADACATVCPFPEHS